MRVMGDESASVWSEHECCGMRDEGVKGGLQWNEIRVLLIGDGAMGHVEG